MRAYRTLYCIIVCISATNSIGKTKEQRVLSSNKRISCWNPPSDAENQTHGVSCWSKSVTGRRKWIQIRRRRWWWRRQRRCKLCTVGVVGVQSIERNEDLLRRCRRRPRRLTEMTPQFHLRPISGFGASSRFAPSNVHSNKHAHHGRPGFCGLCFTTVLSLSSLLYMHLSLSHTHSPTLSLSISLLSVSVTRRTRYTIMNRIGFSTFHIIYNIQVI